MEVASEQLAEPVITNPGSHEPLQNVEVWIAVALDEDRSVLDDRDVPPDYGAVADAINQAFGGTERRSGSKRSRG